MPLLPISCEVVDLASESPAVGPHILLVMTIALTIRDISSVDTAERMRCLEHNAAVALVVLAVADTWF